MPFAPGAHPEYKPDIRHNDLTGFDKEDLKRFRCSHPTLTNQEAMSISKLNYEHTQNMGMSHGLYLPKNSTEGSKSLPLWH
ncbi:hypothetical protein [uncultured Duncaniella sp.]|uniref:hypothetical protein n=1 Tax=uncultured Duncaniella sp. TaxID=2768039 RepID=UPI002620D8DF|nr:hypothetical protein [uncultured Duncaniella sp.]